MIGAAALERQRAALQHIIVTGESALARWSATNPMRDSVARQVNEARADLARMGGN